MVGPISNSPLEKTAKLILGDDFYELARFFLNIYERCLAFEQEGVPVIVAFVTRRCHVLSLIFHTIFAQYKTDCSNQMFANLKAPFSFEDYQRVSDLYYTTDINLTCLGTQITHYYEKNQSFPHIIVVDELLLHGRTLNTVLKSLEDTILPSISMPSSTLPQTLDLDAFRAAAYRRVQSQFLANLELQVFIQNDDPLLLLSQYQRQLWAQSIRPPVQVRERSKQFSLLVSVAAVNNNSYSWSVCSPNRLRPNSNIPDVEQVVTFHSNIRQTTFLWAYPSKQRPTALLSFRQKHSNLGPNESDNQWLGVPFAITGNVQKEALLSLYHQLNNDIPQELHSFFQRYFHEEASPPRHTERIRCQRLLEIIDLILCGLFTKRLFANGIPVFDLDLDMLSRNFKDFRGILNSERNTENVQNELAALWNFLMAQPAGKLEEYLELLLQNAEPIWEMPQISDTFYPVDEKDTKRLQRVLDLTVAKLGYETEANAYRRYSRNLISEEKQPFWGPCFCLDSQLSQLLLACNNDLGQVYTLVALLIQQMDLGIIGIRPALSEPSSENEQEKSCITLELRAGEQSLAIKPILYQKYIPVLVEIKERCGENWDDIETELNRFIRNLNQAGKKVKPTFAWTLLQFLYDLDFVGQRPQDWNFPLIDSVPKWEFEDDSVKSYSGGEALLRCMEEQQELLRIYNRV